MIDVSDREKFLEVLLLLCSSLLLISSVLNKRKNKPIKKTQNGKNPKVINKELAERKQSYQAMEP